MDDTLQELAAKFWGVEMQDYPQATLVRYAALIAATVLRDMPQGERDSAALVAIATITLAVLPQESEQ